MTVIASHLEHADGSELYAFDIRGRHLRTVDTMTNVVLTRFEYGTDGRVSGVVDADGRRTTVTRNSSGVPTSIVGPYNDTTTLEVDGGYPARIVAAWRIQGGEKVTSVFPANIAWTSEASKGRGPRYSTPARFQITEGVWTEPTWSVVLEDITSPDVNRQSNHHDHLRLARIGTVIRR